MEKKSLSWTTFKNTFDSITEMVYYQNMKKHSKRDARGHPLKNANLILVFSMVFVMATPVVVNAAMNHAEARVISESIEESAKLLQKGMNNSKAAIEKEIKAAIVNDGLDYYLTIQSYENQPDPYAAADYNELLLAYATCKEYTNTISKAMLYQLPFYTVEIKESTIEEPIPVLVQNYEPEKDSSIYFVQTTSTYIDYETDIKQYVETEDGKFIENGTTHYIPEMEQTKYGEVSVKGLTADDIFQYYGLEDNKSAHDAYERKLQIARSILNGRGLRETVYVNMPWIETEDDDTKALITNLLNDTELSFERQAVIATAESLIGKVPYEWGGKSSKPGYDTTWWTITEEGKSKGLDCSGFVQWSFRTAGLSAWENLLSTQSILQNTETISSEALTPGDLGFLNNGEGINHVGIYLGDGFWIHCSSAAGTVIVQKTDMFQIYKKFPTSDWYKTDVDDITGVNFTEEDVYLLAQTIHHEAHTEGINGWVGVAEVIRNRMESEKYPDTLRGVVFQKDDDGKTQFESCEEIPGIEPTDDELKIARAVLSGNLSIFNDKNVMYFRNAKGSTQDWGKFPYFASINNHQFYLQN